MGMFGEDVHQSPRRNKNRHLCELLTWQMLDGSAGEKGRQMSRLPLMPQALVKVRVIHILPAANAMDCFLDHHPRHLLLPNCTPARLSPFAHDNVAEL